MNKWRNMSWTALFVVFVIGSTWLMAAPQNGRTTSSGSVLLTGTIKSASGKAMEGVAVSAKADGKTITTSVFTDEKGNYYFPPITPGKYQVWAQATGFATGKSSAAGSGVQHEDFTLSELKDFTRQLTGAEYMAAWPEDTANDRRMKQLFRNQCADCHEPSYPLSFRFDEDGWVSAMNVMRRVNFDGDSAPMDSAPNPVIEYHKKELAAYLAKLRGPGQSPMKFTPSARPTGDAARAVFTEYDVPYDIPGRPYSIDNGSDWSLGTPSRMNENHGPHDAVGDLHGNIWFTDNWLNKIRTIGRADGETGEVTEFKLDAPNGYALATHGMTRSPDGMIWFNIQRGASAEGEGAGGRLGRVDPSTGKIDLFAPPKGMAGVGGTLDTDKNGYVWAVTNSGALRFDPKTQQWMEFKNITGLTAEGGVRTYGMAADSEGNGWWTLMGVDRVDKADTKTSKSSEVKLDPLPGMKELLSPEELKVYELSATDPPWRQGPRRIGADKNGDSVWAADWFGGSIAKIDIHTMKVTFVPLPNPDGAAYGTEVDSRHNVWVPLKNADQIAKYTPQTGQWTLYSLPTRGADLRYTNVVEQNGATSIVVGYSKTSKVARLSFRTKEDLEALQKQVEQARTQARMQ